MDPRIALGLLSALGAFAGAALMIATTPDTGVMPAPIAAAPPEEAAAPDAAPDAGLPLDDAGLSPTPPQAPEPGLASADDPFGLPPADGDPWKDLQATPSPPDGTARVNPLHPQQGVIVQPGGPYPADVRGVGQLFRDREADVRDCMSREGPAANPGEVAVMLRLHLKTDPGSPQGGGIERIEAVQDTEGRYQHFLTCAQTALQGAPLQAPSAGTGIVHWSVRR